MNEAGLLSALVAVIAAALWLSRPKVRLLSSDTTRALPSGAKMVQLTHGTTRFQLSGADNPGFLVVLIHGFLGSSGNLAYLAQELSIKHRRRVLSYDNFGRGHSACDGSPHTATHFANQLSELLEAIDGQSGSVVTHGLPIDLVGYSMGGAIAAQFTALVGRKKVRTYAGIAPAGTSAVPLPSWVPVVLRIPVLPSLIVSRLTTPAALVGRAEWVNPRACPHFGEFTREQYQRSLEEGPALGQAALNTLRHFPMSASGESIYAALGTTGVPSLLIWGQMDSVVPVAGVARITEHVPHADVVLHDDATHALPLEFPHLVAEGLVKWWGKHLK